MTELTTEKHAQHHAGLQAMQEKIDRIEQHAYERAKKMKVHAPRKFAKRAARSHRVQLNGAWRAHLRSAHGVKDIGPFVTVPELIDMHKQHHDGKEQ